MVVVCNENDFLKGKKLNKVHKIILSVDMEDVKEGDFVTQMKSLLPDAELMHSYYNDEISEKKYRKKYIEYLESEEVYPSVLILLMIYKQEKKLAIVCSQQERQFKYIEYFLDYIHDKFDVPIMTYLKWKAKKFVDNFNINKSFLKKEVLKNGHEIFGDAFDEKDKKKNKSSKSKKALDDFDDIDVKTKLKKIKVRRV